MALAKPCEGRTAREEDNSMQAENMGQPEQSAVSPRDNDATLSSPTPSNPAGIRRGGLRALTAILVADRKKRNQVIENTPLSDGPSER